MPSLLLGIYLVALVTLTAFIASKKIGSVLAALLFGLLLHELLIRELTHALQVSPEVLRAISLWKDAVLIGLIIAAGLCYRDRIHEALSMAGRISLSAGVVLVAWGIVSVVVSPNRLAGVAAFRDYFEPITILGLALLARPSRREYRRFIVIWLVLGVGIGVLGVWQGAAWTENDYIRYGFGLPTPEAGMPIVVVDGEVFHRPVSTVTGPNELGFHMVLLCIFSLLLMMRGDRRTKAIAGAAFLIFSACLFYTRSRSDLIAYVLSIGTLAVMGIYQQKSSVRNISKWWFAVASVIFLILIGGLFLTDMPTHLWITFADLKSEYHVVDVREAIEYLATDPGGVGMGLAGPRIGAFFPETPAFHAEGSLFQIALDMGMFGLLLWLAFISSILVSISRRLVPTGELILHVSQVSALVGWGSALLVFLILPLMQSMTLMSWLWFFLGIGFNGGVLHDQWRLERQHSSLELNETAR